MYPLFFIFVFLLVCTCAGIRTSKQPNAQKQACLRPLFRPFLLPFCLPHHLALLLLPLRSRQLRSCDCGMCTPASVGDCKPVFFLFLLSSSPISTLHSNISTGLCMPGTAYIICIIFIRDATVCLLFSVVGECFLQ